MQARHNPLLFDCVTGLDVFRGIRPAHVVDIHYDEHTPEWQTAGAAGDDPRGPHTRLIERHVHDREPEPRRAALIAAKIDLDWDGDEAPTRVLGGTRELPVVARNPNATQELDPIDFDLVTDPLELAQLSGSSPDDNLPLEAAKSERDRPHQRWLIPSILAAAVVASTGLYWLFAGRASCAVSIETSPADAQVTLDGERLNGVHSPYRKAAVRLGQHQLVVEQPGFVPLHQTLALTKPSAEQVFIVSLAADVREATLSVSSIPSGATIGVDGQQTGATTPAALTQLSLGEHTITLKLDGYADAEQSVRVPEDALVSITLVRSATPDVSAQPGYSAAAARAAARQLRADIRAAKSTLRERARKSLPPDPAALALLDSVAATPEAAANSGGAQSSLAHANTGTLVVYSRPPGADAYVDGQSVGRTPVRSLELQPGRHSVRLENSKLQLSKTLEVTVTAGKKLTKVEDLRQ